MLGHLHGETSWVTLIRQQYMQADEGSGTPEREHRIRSESLRASREQAEGPMVPQLIAALCA